MQLKRHHNLVQHLKSITWAYCYSRSVLYAGWGSKTYSPAKSPDNWWGHSSSRTVCKTRSNQNPLNRRRTYNSERPLWYYWYTHILIEIWYYVMYWLLEITLLEIASSSFTTVCLFKKFTGRFVYSGVWCVNWYQSSMPLSFGCWHLWTVPPKSTCNMKQRSE